MESIADILMLTWIAILLGVCIVGLVCSFIWVYRRLIKNNKRPKINKHTQKEMDQFHQFVNDFERLVTLIERYDTLKDDIPDWMKGGHL